MEERERNIRKRLRDDFVHYALKCLVINLKSGGSSKLKLNKAQLYIHEKIEEQLAKTGKVRAIILKGRQQGCSTYVEARMFWKVSYTAGVKAYILTHHKDATDNLFDMAARFYEYCPELVKPRLGVHNAKELSFPDLDSGYKVGTAGTKEVGRSGTIQYFHGSEVPVWPNSAEHAAGILQCISNSPGTEIILEGTAKGMGNYFHEQWEIAEAGMSEYIAIFVPWYWQDEYAAKAPEGFKITDEEYKLMNIYELTLEQIVWRRIKLTELGEKKFKQEYPFVPSEAFQTTGEGLIDPMLISAARKFKAEPYGTKFVGVDPARMGKDCTAIITRQGRHVSNLRIIKKHDAMEVVGIIVQIIKNEKPDIICIDGCNLGDAITDRLHELGHKDIVKNIKTGASKTVLNRKSYANKRAEMWDEMKKWLEQEDVQIPDSNYLHGHIAAPSFRYTSSDQLLIESKENMRKRGQSSPDSGDALALTFAFPYKKSNAKIGNLFNPVINF